MHYPKVYHLFVYIARNVHTKFHEVFRSNWKECEYLKQDFLGNKKIQSVL
jgi:hypothetical protein